MNNKILIVLAALLVAGGAWFFMNRNDASEQTSTDTQTAEQNDLSEIDSSSIEALLAQNRNMICSYSYTDESGTGSGTVYFASDQRMRGQFTYQGTDGESQTGSIIQDGEFQYIWDETTNEGFKMALGSFDEMDDSDEGVAVSNDGFDTDEDYNFDCSEWQVDESIFAVPSDVQFTDFSEQLEQLQNFNSSDASAACSQLETAEQRAACEEAF